MKSILSFSFLIALAACAGKPAQVAPVAKADAPVWRYAVRMGADGARRAFAVDMNSDAEIPLPEGLWCPHGALIELKRDAKGKVVGAESRAEPVEVKIGSGPALPAFALAPAAGQKQPFVVLRWQPAKDQTDWAILERRPDGLRVTEMGPWQVEHIQFQRLERPGPGLENCVLLTFQAGEGSQDAVVRVEVGAQGAKLRPLSGRDAQVLQNFLGRATAGEREVVGRVLGEK